MQSGIARQKRIRHSYAKYLGRGIIVSHTTLARRMDISEEEVEEIAQSLIQKGYLRRRCVDPAKGLWEWDLSGVIERALEIEAELKVKNGRH